MSKIYTYTIVSRFYKTSALAGLEKRKKSSWVLLDVRCWILEAGKRASHLSCPVITSTCCVLLFYRLNKEVYFFPKVCKRSWRPWYVLFFLNAGGKIRIKRKAFSCSYPVSRIQYLSIPCTKLSYKTLAQTWLFRTESHSIRILSVSITGTRTYNNHVAPGRA